MYTFTMLRRCLFCAFNLSTTIVENNEINCFAMYKFVYSQRLSIGNEIFKILLEFVVFSKASTNILLVLLPSIFNNYE